MSHGVPDADAITSIKPLRGDPLRRAVRVGRQIVARIDLQTVSQLGLREGMLWDDALATRVLNAEQSDKLRATALRMIGRRAYGSDELADKLRRKEFPADEVEALIERLIQQRFLNDELYGQALIRSIQGRSPTGERLMRQKLMLKKLPADLIDRLMRENAQITDPVADARRMAEKKLRSNTLQRCEPAVRNRRLWGALMRRGFNADTIRKALAGLDSLSNDAASSY